MYIYKYTYIYSYLSIYLSICSFTYDTYKEFGVGFLAYSPLGMGRLTGKYDSKKNKAPAGRFFGRVPAGTLDPLVSLTLTLNPEPKA